MMLSINRELSGRGKIRNKVERGDKTRWLSSKGIKVELLAKNSVSPVQKTKITVFIRGASF
jgi:hypothetical protein